MLFNSIGFAIFLPIVFILYWIIKSEKFKLQNILLLIASYYFYSCWDWRFLFLLIFSTLLDFFSGLQMAKSQGAKKKFWFLLSIIINLGFLGFFKYYNFFSQSFATFIAGFGFHANFFTLNIILPVGISFYTFHGLSYVIDIYHQRIKPEKNFIDYAVFVCFFPLLVAGPIERASHLLPQVKKERRFDHGKAFSGLKQILWGLFKKMVIADNCAEFANFTFQHSSNCNGSTLLLGAVFFAFQIYGDFSGYSDIAIGTAKLFGFDLLRNFAYPYFSRDIAEFWRRWHISLTTWFRDYLYIPLGGSKGGTLMKIRNTFIIFIVSGFWHGANWTFVLWGFINALYFLPLLISKRNRQHIEIVAYNKIFPSLREFFSILFTFMLTVFAWIFFRANTIANAIKYLSGIFSKSILKVPAFPNNKNAIAISLLVCFFFILEWIGRESQFAIEKIGKNYSRFFRWSLYTLIIFLIGMFAQTKETPFIYFQF